ncbi:MAG: HD domain-containing protein [Planctomycetota bacterium]
MALLGDPELQSTLRRERVLVLNEDRELRQQLAHHLLRHGFLAYETASVGAALEQCAEAPFFLALIGRSLPGGADGLDVLATLREHWPDTGLVLTAPAVQVELAVAALRAGAFDIVSQPFPFATVLSLIDRLHEKRFLDRRANEILRIQEREKVQAKLHTQFMISLARIIDAKSKYTKEHSERVGKIARHVAQEFGLSPSELDRVEIGGKLHDIGKIGTPEAILNKPGPLSAAEVKLMKDHPVVGHELIKPISFMQPYATMIRNHHECHDGVNGYPDGLQGNEIAVEAQIVKLADYYDAITSRRPYREPMKPLQALETIELERGKAFRPDLLDALASYLKRRAQRAGKPVVVDANDPAPQVPTPA